MAEVEVVVVVGVEVSGDGECQSFCSINDVVGDSRFDVESGSCLIYR